MNTEQSEDSFWEEHRLGLGMTVGGLLATVGALVMHRLSKPQIDLQSGEHEISHDDNLDEAPKTD